MATRTLSPSGKGLLFFFFGITLLNLYAESTINQCLIYFSKPLLVTSLAVFFYRESANKPGKFRNFILFALTFSVFGDTLLMFVEQNPDKAYFFLLGLGSFLIAHLFYIAAFVNYPNTKAGYCKRKPQIFLPFILLLISLNAYLLPDIPSELKIPVVFYGLAIIGMSLACINLYGKLNDNIFIGLLFGALFFLFSDTVIGLNKFKLGSVSLVNPRVLIMSTYIVAQFLISFFALKANDEIP